MPSPTSITVPTSLTCTRCSKEAISCFRMLVISATLMAMSSPMNPRLLLPTRPQEPLAHRLELVADAGVDQPVFHAQHQAADDVLVDVLVHDRVLSQRLAHPLAHLRELFAAELFGDRDVHLDLAGLLVQQRRVRLGNLPQQPKP